MQSSRLAYAVVKSNQRLRCLPTDCWILYKVNVSFGGRGLLYLQLACISLMSNME